MFEPDSTVINKFRYEGTYKSMEKNTSGLINNTFILTFEKDNGEEIMYSLQRVNTKVFTKPYQLMDNIVGVTKHLRDKIIAAGGNPDRETLNFIPAINGKYGFEDRDGSFWRTYRYVDKVIAHNKIDRPGLFRNAGVGFGHFQNLLADYPSVELFETIPSFHNTVNRYYKLMDAVQKNIMGRADEVREEIEFYKAHKDYCKIILDGLADGSIPLRVTHNDTKLNNVLMDAETDKAVCVIDLDTIMPGSALYDFGDAIRFGANSATEDEPNLDIVHFVPERFEEFTDGFLSEVAGTFTEAEISNLANAAIIMTMECGIRFLTDYLEGDVYFHIDRPSHNLDRTRTQIRMIQEMESQLDSLNAKVKEIADKYRA